MFDVRKPEQKHIVVIRAASGNELSNYEKQMLAKLKTVEHNAQENKIEVIKVNGQTVEIDPLNKEAKINLGLLAHKDKVSQDEISPDELFLIKCELENNSIKD